MITEKVHLRKAGHLLYDAQSFSNLRYLLLTNSCFCLIIITRKPSCQARNFGDTFPVYSSRGAGSLEVTPGTCSYQLAHAPLGCKAIHALVVDAHFTGFATQSMFSICSCQTYGELLLEYPLLSTRIKSTEKWLVS